MRKSVRDQLPLVVAPHAHVHARELGAMSKILDEHPECSRWVLADLVRGGIDRARGRGGMTGEQVLRALIVKQSNGFSYKELAFHLGDSYCYRAFCRIGLAEAAPKRSTLQENIKSIRPRTLERINQTLVQYGVRRGIEDGEKVRGDSTVIEADVHEPLDSNLLYDSVRVLARLLHGARAYCDASFTDHTRRAKRRAIAILHAGRMEKRVPLYRELIQLTEKTARAARRTVEKLEASYPVEALEVPALHSLREDLMHFIRLAEKVVDQTRRRVFDNEVVPAKEKVVSIFEPHTDIIKKDRRDTLYGHKAFLTTGASGLVLDCIVDRGNPNDSTLAVRLVDRATHVLGRIPKQTVFDGGFSTRDNITTLKQRGVSDVAFSKTVGIPISEMVKDSWVFRRLRRFRAGIEGVISFLKRCFGWSCCTWRTFESFKAYAWSSVVAANLLVLARHALH